MTQNPPTSKRPQLAAKITPPVFAPLPYLPQGSGANEHKMPRPQVTRQPASAR